MATRTVSEQAARQPSTRQGNDTLLRRALGGNAAFSATSGILFIVAGGALADFLEVESALALRVLGVGLLLWALDVLYVATQAPIKRALARLVIGGDALWVIGSIVVIALDLFSISSGGKWAVLAVADIVATFGIAQYISLRRLG